MQSRVLLAERACKALHVLRQWRHVHPSGAASERPREQRERSARDSSKQVEFGLQ